MYKLKFPQERIDEIFKDITETVVLSDEYKEYRIYDIVLCYYLWLAQTDRTLREYEQIEMRCFREHPFDIPLEVMAETLWDIYQFPDKLEKFFDLVGKYSDEELAECITNKIVLSNWSKIYDLEIDGVSNTVLHLLSIQGGEKVLHLDSHFPSFAQEGKVRYANCEFVSCNESAFPLALAAILSEVNNLPEVRYQVERDEEVKYNRIYLQNLIDSPVRVGEWRGEEDIKEYWAEFPPVSSYEWNSCGVALQSLEDGGRIISVMDAGPLTVKQSVDARKFLCDNGYIEGVIMLPDRVCSSTWVNPYIVILNKNGNKKIKFYDASGMCVSGRAYGKRINILTDELVEQITHNYNHNIDTVAVDISQIKENDYNLNPLRYLDNVGEADETITLGNVIREIKRGVSMSAADMDELISEESSEIKCILPSGINEGVVTSNLYYHGTIKKPGKNEVKEGQLLISKTGNPFRVCLAQGDYLVVGNTYILDIDTSKIDPAYLRCYLSSKRGQDEMRKYAVGPSTPVINVSEIHKIQIPVFDEEKQNAINVKCWKIIDNMEECYRQILDAKEKVEAMFE